MNRRALLIGAGVLAAVAGNGIVMWQRTRARHPRFAYQARTTSLEALSSLATGGSSVVTTTGRRGRLAGLYREPKTEAAPLVVHFPGNGTSVLSEAQQHLAALTAGTDAGTLCFAPAGFDASEGEASLTAVVEDVVAVLAFVRDMHPQRRVVVSAFSLGALPALVARTLVDASFPTVLFAPFTTIEVGHPGLLGRVWSADTYDTRAYVREPGGPIVIVHGTLDPYFPLAMGRELTARAGARAELVVVEGVAHLELPSHETARLTFARVLASLSGNTG